MKITFVALGSEQLAISLFVNMARAAGHDVSLAYNVALFHDRFNLEIPWLNKYFDDTEDTIEQIQQQQPDILIFSSLTATYQWMLEIARRSKEFMPNVKVVFGGVHPSAVPERVIKRAQVDFVVVGEGEVCLIPIIDAIATSNYSTPIPNTWFKTPEGNIIKGGQLGFYQSLDTLPPFTKEIWEPYISVSDRYLTMASRGCPYRCTFCFNNFYAELPDDKKTKGKYVRTRSVEHVIDELRYAKKRYKNFKRVNFEDDIFTVNKPWLKEFLIRYKEEIDVPFQCLTHPRYMDDEIAQWLVAAGCNWVQMGIQSMDEDFKIKSLRRNERGDHIRNSLKVMIKHGLNVKVDHMFGLPGESIESQEIARELYAKHCPKRIQTYWTCFLPGTEILEQGIKEGLLSEEDAERLNEGEDFYFFRNPDNIKNPKTVAKYKAYELLFKLYPLLPKFIRLRLKTYHVIWIPDSVKGIIYFCSDLLQGIITWNPDFIVYGKYYIFHLTKFFLRKTGIKNNWSASSVRKKEMYNLNRSNNYIPAQEVNEII